MAGAGDQHGGIVAPVLLMFGLTLNSVESALLLNLEGLGDDGNRLAGLPRECRPAPAARSVRPFLRRGAAVMRKARGLPSTLAPACRWGLPRLGDRQQFHAQDLGDRSRYHRHAKGLVADAVNVGLAVIAGASFPAAPIIVATAAVGFFGIGVSLVMFILALRHLGTARTGAYSSIAPFIGALLAIAFLGDPLTLKLAIAGFLMGSAYGSIFRTARSRARPRGAGTRAQPCA